MMEYTRKMCNKRFYQKVLWDNWICLLAVILLAAIPKCGCKVHQGATVCEKFDQKLCLEHKGPCTSTIEVCGNITDPNNVPLDENNHMLCFATWVMNGSQELLVTKGCWMNDIRCFGKNECVETRYMSPLFFCCCDGDLCNKEFIHRPSEDSPQDVVKEVEPADVVIRTGDQLLITALLYSIVPIIGLGAIVVALFFMWKRHQHHIGHTQLPTMDPSLSITPSHSTLNLHLLELRARGRYGSLWKAQLPEQDDSKVCLTDGNPMKHVAVKIFPMQDRQSWVSELDIYNLPHMRHENILRFIAPETRVGSLATELWLITEFHEKGSLCDYLKGNTVTWTQLCRVLESMTCGLAYLHDEIPATYNGLAKPAIAHRDFKSKNVLLKQDLTACIADFGLALKFEPGKVFNETHPQVGTRRYMAPEVLEGAICFNLDSFLRIDMYACGLIIWELMTRCSSIVGPVESYHLPFEVEVGLQPTLEEMQTLVVTQKKRPATRAAWYKHPGLCSLICTVEECWDQDAEARLSAGCVKERIVQLARTINSGSEVPLSEQFVSSPPLLVHSLPNTNTISPSYMPNPAIINTDSALSFVGAPNDPTLC